MDPSSLGIPLSNRGSYIAVIYVGYKKRHHEMFLFFTSVRKRGSRERGRSEHQPLLLVKFEFILKKRRKGSCQRSVWFVVVKIIPSISTSLQRGKI